MSMINDDDINELRRLATNTYENDKAQQILRIIKGINELRSENNELRNKLKDCGKKNSK